MRRKVVKLILGLTLGIFIIITALPIAIGGSSSDNSGTTVSRGGAYILVTEQSWNQVTEYDSNGNAVWKYQNPTGVAINDAERLENGIH